VSATRKEFLIAAIFACALLWGGARSAWAQAASTTPSGLALPDMDGTLIANPNPLSFDLPHFGKVYVTGVASGLVQWQTHPDPGDSTTQVDLSNGQVFVQKTDGLVQFFVQAGLYSLPSLGTAYVNAINTNSDLWGPVPLAFITLAPTQDWSIMAGQLPSLAGLEPTFTFENMNVERGLLWNQTSSVSRGVQLNHSVGPISLALSWNDGVYSGRYSWITGSATWSVNSSDTLALIGAANAGTTIISNVATPVLQNNSQMYNAIYTHTSGPWTVTPYLQFTYVPRTPSIGVLHYGATYGAALLGSYAFGSASKIGGLTLAGFSLPLRLEYIASNGSVSDGAPNLLYGAGSAAWSVTVTPTYQYERFFTRGEFSYVGASHTATGSAFGPNGSDTTQVRLMLEWGLLF
jgi:hypothetical protein